MEMIRFGSKDLVPVTLIAEIIYSLGDFALKIFSRGTFTETGTVSLAEWEADYVINLNLKFDLSYEYCRNQLLRPGRNNQLWQ